MMEAKNREVCDNKCAHGCSSQKQYARVILNNQPNLRVLCTKAMTELKAQPYSLDKKVA